MRAAVVSAALLATFVPAAAHGADGAPIAGPGGCCVNAAVDDDGTARVGYVHNRSDAPSFWSAWALPATALPMGGRLLAIGPSHSTSDLPVFAWDGRGRAVAAWRGAAREVDPSARGVRVYAAVQRADGSWSAPQPLSRLRRGLGARSPVLAVDRAGNAIVAWSAQTRLGWRVEVAHRTADRELFGSRQAVSKADERSGQTAVAVSGAHWVVAWTDAHAVRLLTGAGASARTFAMRARDTNYLENHTVAIGRDGTVAAAWREPRGDGQRWQGAVVAPGAPVVAVRRLGPDQSTDGEIGEAVPPNPGASAVVTPGGQTVFAVSGSAAGRLGIISVAPGASSWTEPEALGVGVGADVNLHASDDGRVAATWTEYLSDDDNAGVHLALRPAGGPFQPPEVVARDPQARWPAVAVRGDRLASAWLSDGLIIRGMATTLP